jgi:hypothetical protein
LWVRAGAPDGCVRHVRYWAMICHDFWKFLICLICSKCQMIVIYPEIVAVSSRCWRNSVWHSICNSKSIFVGGKWHKIQSQTAAPSSCYI